MTTSVIDFFKIDDEDSEPVATLVDHELQDGATAEFIELWRHRPREATYHIGGPEPGFDGCILRVYTATLENEPSRYIGALDGWLLDHGYTFRGRPERRMRRARECQI